MALTIPSELAFVLHLLGFDWPELDEDEIHRGAHILRQFADDIQGTMDEVGARVTGDVPGAVSADAARSYADAWDESQSSMGQFCELLDGAATGVDLAADAVLALKLKVIAELADLPALLRARHDPRGVRHAPARRPLSLRPPPPTTRSGRRRRRPS